MDKVCAIVVTYNRKELLRECITALLKSDYKNLEILIIDNCSTDGTFDFIKDIIDFKKVNYLRSEKNIGGAGGFNLGIKQIKNSDVDYVWLMDDDCIVSVNSLTELVSFAHSKENKFGFLSSVVLWKDGSLCRMNIPKKSLTKHVVNFEEVSELKFSTFVSFFVSVETIKNVGLPIAEFFIWGDDFEYSSRISKKYVSYLVPRSIVTHKSEKNIGSSIEKDSINNLWKYKYAYRNEKYLYDKLGLFAKIYYWLKIRVHYLKIYRSDADNKKLRIKTIKDSLKEAKKFKPEIEFI